MTAPLILAQERERTRLELLSLRTHAEAAAAYHRLKVAEAEAEIARLDKALAKLAEKTGGGEGAARLWNA